MADTKKTANFWADIYEKLSADLPKEAIAKAPKEQTHKLYDMTGYGYQFLVNRFNDVMGVNGWGYAYKIIQDEKGAFSSGRPYHEITVELTLTLRGEGTEISRALAGGHRSELYADALKGAVTNAFKKTAAMFGVGKRAYEGTIDEDMRAMPEVDEAEEAPKARPITTNQAETLRRLLQERRQKLPDNVTIEAMSYVQASQLITKLLAMPRKFSALPERQVEGWTTTSEEEAIAQAEASIPA